MISSVWVHQKRPNVELLHVLPLLIQENAVENYILKNQKANTVSLNRKLNKEIRVGGKIGITFDVLNVVIFELFE